MVTLLFTELTPYASPDTQRPFYNKRIPHLGDLYEFHLPHFFPLGKEQEGC